MWISLSRSGSVNRRHTYVEQENDLEGVHNLSSPASCSFYWKKNSGLRRANSNIETFSSTFRSHWSPSSRSGRLSFSGSSASSPGEVKRLRDATVPLILGRKYSVDSNFPLSTNCGTMTNNTEEPAAATTAASSSDIHDAGDFDRSSLRRRSSKALRRLMVLIKTADQAKEEKENSEDLDNEPQCPSTGSGSSFVPPRPNDTRISRSQEPPETTRFNVPLKLTQGSSQEDPPLEASPEDSETEINSNVLADSQWDANRKIFSNGHWDASEKISGSQWKANGKTFLNSQWSANRKISNSQRNASVEISESQWNANRKISDNQWNANGKLSNSQWNVNGKISDGQWNANGMIPDSQWNANGVIPDSQWNDNGEIPDSQWNVNDNISGSQWNAYEMISDSEWNANGEALDVQWNANDNISDRQWNANANISYSNWNSDGKISDSQCNGNNKAPENQWNSNDKISDNPWNANGVNPDSHWNANEKFSDCQWDADGMISECEWAAIRMIPDSQCNANRKTSDGQWNVNGETSDCQWSASDKIPDSRWNANDKISECQWNANDKISDSQCNINSNTSNSQWNANKKNPDGPWNTNGKIHRDQWNANENISDSQWDVNEKIPDSQWNTNGKISGSQWNTNGKVSLTSQWNPWRNNGETDLDDWDDSVISFGNSVESTTGYLESIVRDESERSPRPPSSPEMRITSEVDYHGVEWGSQDDHEQEGFSSTTFRCSPISLENNNVTISTCPFQNAFAPFERDILKVSDHNKDAMRSFSPFFDPKDPTSISENNVSSTDLAALSWSSVSLTSKDDVIKESGKDSFQMKDVWEKDDFSSTENGGLLACFYQNRNEEEYSDDERLPDPFNDGQTYLRNVKENQSTQDSAKGDVETDWWLKDDFREESGDSGKHQQDWVTFEDDPLDLSTSESFPKTCADLMDPVCTCGAIYRRLKIDQGGKNSTVAPAKALLFHHNSTSNLIGTPKRKRSSTTDSAQPPSSTRRLIRTYSQRSKIAGQRVMNKISRRLYPEEYDKLREPITSKAVLTMLDGPAMRNQHRTPSTDTLLAASLSNQARVLPRQDHQRDPSSSSKESYKEENGNVPYNVRDPSAKTSVPVAPPATSSSSQRSRSTRYLKFPKLSLRRTTSFSNGKVQSPRSSPPSAAESSAPVPWNFSRNSSFWKALQAMQLPSLSNTFRRGSSKAETSGSQTSSSTPRSPVFHTYVRGLSGLPVRVPSSACSPGTVGKGASPAALYWSRPTTPVKVHVVLSSSSSSSYTTTPRAPRLPRRGMKSPT